MIKIRHYSAFRVGTNIRFHRSHATERHGHHYQFLIAERFLQSTTYSNAALASSASWHKIKVIRCLSAHQHSEQQENEILSLEQAVDGKFGMDSDLKGEDQATTANTQQLDTVKSATESISGITSQIFYRQ